MATANNTIKTRIQLKSDTEANWNKAGPKEGSPGFVPLQGELIIYSADSNHTFSRLKVGDGSTNVVDLPFIDAGTLNGEEEIIQKYDSISNFPSPGKTDILYVDLSNNRVYHWTSSNGYIRIGGINLNVTRERLNSFITFRSGVMTNAQVQNNTLQITNGAIPSLAISNTVMVVTNVTEGGNT